MSDASIAPLRIGPGRAIPLQDPAVPAEGPALRAHRLRRLAGALRIFDRRGFGQGATGHVSTRDPAEPGRFWVNSLDRPFALAAPDDFILADGAGAVAGPRGDLDRDALADHAAIYAARPDVNAVIEARSPATAAWATQGRLLAPLTQDSCTFHGDHALHDPFNGTNQGVTSALAGHKAVIVQHRGVLTVAETVETAAWWFITFDDTAKVQLQAEAAGTLAPIEAAVADDTAARTGSPRIGLHGFLTLWQDLAARDPAFAGA
ncbi:class II aldolase/adducin family protein [Zavarzinia compransoris]|uniref:Class II aldolase/adducin family protein n=1 Tax=Zavarzinia compransoris TaxID=1264899 RepID=A0A317DZ07_9PROT|nr:class II aldolase/adducin family protein [Zavarzinia compransoris]PWR18273.1 class II aldolase/adducin family protein [Zavarzinia compransoris]TDP43671.1 ribulose-5-phosphate 4-epimerase/fuculose-1-phosphate aldolase [Zavarzinia compransoris]